MVRTDEIMARPRTLACAPPALQVHSPFFRCWMGYRVFSEIGVLPSVWTLQILDRIRSGSFSGGQAQVSPCCPLNSDACGVAVLMGTAPVRGISSKNLFCRRYSCAQYGVENVSGAAIALYANQCVKAGSLGRLTVLPLDLAARCAGYGEAAILEQIHPVWSPRSR